MPAFDQLHTLAQIFAHDAQKTPNDAETPNPARQKLRAICRDGNYLEISAEFTTNELPSEQWNRSISALLKQWERLRIAEEERRVAPEAGTLGQTPQGHQKRFSEIFDAIPQTLFQLLTESKLLGNKRSLVQGGFPDQIANAYPHWQISDFIDQVAGLLLPVRAIDDGQSKETLASLLADSESNASFTQTDTSEEACARRLADSGKCSSLFHLNETRRHAIHTLIVNTPWLELSRRQQERLMGRLAFLYTKTRNQVFYQANLFFALQAATQREALAFHGQKFVDRVVQQGSFDKDSRLAFRRLKRVLTQECGEIEKFITVILAQRAQIGSVIQSLRQPQRSNPSTETGWLGPRDPLLDNGVRSLDLEPEFPPVSRAKTASSTSPAFRSIPNVIWPTQPWPITQSRQINEVIAFYETYEEHLGKHALRLSDCQKVLKTTADRFAPVLARSSQRRPSSEQSGQGLITP